MQSEGSEPATPVLRIVLWRALRVGSGTGLVDHASWSDRPGSTAVGANESFFKDHGELPSLPHMLDPSRESGVDYGEVCASF